MPRKPKAAPNNQVSEAHASAPEALREYRRNMAILRFGDDIEPHLDADGYVPEADAVHALR